MATTFKKGLVLSLGPITTSVDLTSVIPTSRDSSLHRICKDHKRQLKQQYYCQEGDHTVNWNEWYLAGEAGDSYYAVEPNSKPEKEPSNSLTMTPVPTEQIDLETLEGPSMYYLKPSSEAYNLTWSMFYKAAQKSKTTLVARGILRRGVNERLFKLTTFNNYLVLREIYFPENIAEPPAEISLSPVDRETQKLFNELMERVTTDFSALNVESTKEKDTKEWLRSGTKIEWHDERGKPKPTNEQSAMDLQEALLKAVGRKDK